MSAVEKLLEQARRVPPRERRQLVARLELGKRLRRWLAAEVALRSDTAAPDRAERLATLAAALAASGR